MNSVHRSAFVNDPRNVYTIPAFSIHLLNEILIIQHSESVPDTSIRGFFDLPVGHIEINWAVFEHSMGYLIQVNQVAGALQTHCNCSASKIKMCDHQAQALHNVHKNQDLLIFFDEALRFRKMRAKAYDYGLEAEPDLMKYFRVHYQEKQTHILPKNPALFAFTNDTKVALQDQLLSANHWQHLSNSSAQENLIVVFKLHKYFDHFHLELYQADFTKEGKPKNPLISRAPLDKIWQIEEPDVLKFFMAVARFQHNYEQTPPEEDSASLKALVKNPLTLPVFYHNHKTSVNIASQSIVPVQLSTLPIELQLEVFQQDEMYEIKVYLQVNGQVYPLQDLTLKYGYFIQIHQTMYLVDNLHFLKVIAFFRRHNYYLVLHESKYTEFQKEILDPLERHVRVKYSYLKPASPEQIQEVNLNQALVRMIYLSEYEDYILLTPTMVYGEVEIPVLSKKQLYAIDRKGKPFSLPRNEPEEQRFLGILIRQHPDFEEQLHQESFYLHRKRFLENEWFLDAFEVWREQQIKILGFNQFKKTRLNAHKAHVSVVVNSGMNWFDTTIKIQFGKQRVSLKHLQKTIKNKEKYVTLDDGSVGILPESWVSKFADYFQAGEIVEETLRVPQSRLGSLEELFDAEMLTQEVKALSQDFRDKIENLDKIAPIQVTSSLHAQLRSYQSEGLNWLAYLNQLSLGGVLADDMGLGKTLQVLALFLWQKEKSTLKTNLVVVPTTLIFNWLQEIKKFAPSLKVLVMHGPNRPENTLGFEEYDVVITTYHTLLSDIKFLRKYLFNYIVLDESQAIKNPESQRYKAVCMLQSRHRLVMTGTPIENNTFDIYAQFSFACPGLLGTKRFFKEYYSMPIDKFKDLPRAQELQQKIKPFVLRRTKQQVAKELPEKTEMVLYCEMSTEQRRVYEAYEREFWAYLNTQKEGDIPKERLHILQGLTKLRQICNSPALLSDEEFYGHESAKLQVLIEEIENKSPKHKILVFSQFVEMLELVKKELQLRDIPFSYLTGQTTNRAKVVEQFQNDDQIRVFLISLKAGGIGLNLTQADYVYLIDPWWNPAVENQAIDRVYRIGQQKNVVAVRLICPDTIEEKMMVLQSNKQHLVNELIKTDQDMLQQMTKDDLLRLLKHG